MFLCRKPSKLNLQTPSQAESQRPPQELQILSSSDDIEGFDSQRDSASPAKPQIVFLAKEMADP